MRSMSLQFWLAKRSNDRWVRFHAANDIRRRMRHQWAFDYSKRGKGNRAWKRVDAINNEPGTILWPDYALRRTL